MVDTQKLDSLFTELVPLSGPAANLAGEIVRAAERIVYRWYNDGDHIGVGYGRKTCNPPARFLAMETNKEIELTIEDMWGINSEIDYKPCLQDLIDSVVEYVTTNKDRLMSFPSPDMWSDRYCDDIEDNPYMDEDEDEDY